MRWIWSGWTVGWERAVTIWKRFAIRRQQSEVVHLEEAASLFELRGTLKLENLKAKVFTCFGSLSCPLVNLERARLNRKIRDLNFSRSSGMNL